MTVAIEVINTHWDQGYDTPAWLKLADLQAHGALVLGEWQPCVTSTGRPRAFISNKQYRGDARKGTHPLGSPNLGLARVCQTRHARGTHFGRWVHCDDRIVERVYRAARGDHVVVSFAALGRLAFNFESRMIHWAAA